MTDTTHIIVDLQTLQAMTDNDLNAMAAELRGWSLQNVTDPTGNSFLNWVDGNDVGQYSSGEWQPATDRNQSGELLEWLADQGFSVSIGRDRFTIVNVGISHSDYGRIGAHEKRWPRAETVAFCAAMLAMEGRLK